MGSYFEGGPEALEYRPSTPRRVWKRIAPEVQDQNIDIAPEHSELSPKELAVRITDEKLYFVSDATVYRLLKAHVLITSPAFTVSNVVDAFYTQTTRPNERWQTDFTYIKMIELDWMYLWTALDNYSRYIIAWKLCSTMKAGDVTHKLDLALAASGCDHANGLHRPKLLSDNSPSYIAGELAQYIEANQISYARGAALHAQTQGEIERWHQALKNRVLLENYFLSSDLERQIEAFVVRYSHKSLDNVTSASAGPTSSNNEKEPTDRRKDIGASFTASSPPKTKTN